MAKIIPFPSTQKQTSEMVDRILASRMPDKDPAVLRCLKGEMTELVEKFFHEEDLSLSMVLPTDLSEEQFSRIEAEIQKTVGKHNRYMNMRVNQMFLELCMSRMMICELRHRLGQDRT